MCTLLKQALSILARHTGELSANYQDAVKGVLTVSRPTAMGRGNRSGKFPNISPHSIANFTLAQGPGRSRI